MPKEAGVPELRGLFDLERDLADRENLIAARPEIAHRLEGAIRAWLKEERRLSFGSETKARDAELLERLRGLGYVIE